MKRLLALALVGALALVAGCGKPLGPGVSRPIEQPCAPGEKWISGYASIANIDGTVMFEPITLTVQAISPAPNYGGVMRVEAGTGAPAYDGANPVTLERRSPWNGEYCWPPEYPLALLLRVTAVIEAVGDEVECTLDDGYKPANTLAEAFDEDLATATAVDLIPPRGGWNNGFDAPVLIAQCVHYYYPGGWTGPYLPNFNPKPEI